MRKLRKQQIGSCPEPRSLLFEQRLRLNIAGEPLSPRVIWVRSNRSCETPGRRLFVDCIQALAHELCLDRTGFALVWRSGLHGLEMPRRRVRN